MKRLLDRVLSRWYVPVERYDEATQRNIQDRRIVVETLAEARRILRDAGYHPHPVVTTDYHRRTLCS